MQTEDQDLQDTKWKSAKHSTSQSARRPISQIGPNEALSVAPTFIPRFDWLFDGWVERAKLSKLKWQYALSISRGCTEKNSCTPILNQIDNLEEQYFKSLQKHQAAIPTNLFD